MKTSKIAAANRIAARRQIRDARMVNMLDNTSITRARLFQAVEAMNAANAAWAVVVAARVQA